MPLSPTISVGGALGIGSGDPTVAVPLEDSSSTQGDQPTAAGLEICTTPAGISQGDAQADQIIDDFEDVDSFGDALLMDAAGGLPGTRA